ncbi:hypothetical protein [Ruminococcus sp.]|jgi:hypothetical protein|nr:hypothetical protein [Ruminococcus sp.]
MSKNFTELSAKEKNETNGGGLVQTVAQWLKEHFSLGTGIL